MDAPKHSDESPSDERAKRDVQLDEIANAETLEDIVDDTAETLGRPPTRQLFDDPDALGEFQLVGRLGSGGYGEVVRATDLRLERDVAIKIVKQERAGDASQRKRFLEEARSVAKLRHPNIVPVHQVGEIGSGIPFIVYEFIDGPTLRKRAWKKKQFEPEETVALLVKIADGLGYAHELGIVHRDVKPANILIERKTGEPHIADFGCASTIDIGQPTEETDDRPYVGTLAYFSPEQAAGLSHRADARTDVWALGVVMDEMLTGKRYRAELDEVFQGESDDLPRYLNKLQTYRPSPLRERVPSVDADLNAIWEKCVAVDANHRYNNANELAEEFRRWQRQEPILARPIGLGERLVRWAKRNPQVAGSLAAVFGTILLASFIMLLFNRELRSANREIIASAVNDIVDVDASGLPHAVRRINAESYRDVATDLLKQRWLSASESSPVAGSTGRDAWRLSLGLAALGEQPPTFVDQMLLRSTTAAELQAGCEAVDSTDVDLAWVHQRLRESIGNSKPDHAAKLRALLALSLMGRLDDASETASQRVSELLYELESRELDEGLVWIPLARKQFPDLGAQLVDLLGTKNSDADRNVVERLRVKAADNHIDLLRQLADQPLEEILPTLKLHIDALPDRMNFAEFASLATGNATDVDPVMTGKLWLAYLYCSDFEHDLNQLDQHLLRSTYPDFENGPGKTPDDGHVRDRTALTVFVCQAKESKIAWQKIWRMCDVWHSRGDERLEDMLIALGGFPAPANISDSTKERLHEIWVNAGDSGTHGACEWLMTRWDLERDVRRLPAEYAPDRNWRFRNGKLFVRIRKPPQPFQVGSTKEQISQFIKPPPQWKGDPDEYVDGFNDFADERYEVAHPHQIVGDFEISAYEITESQFAEFLLESAEDTGTRERTETRRMTRGNGKLPAARLCWYDAVEYCVWHSLKEDKPCCYGDAESFAAFSKSLAAVYLKDVLPCNRSLGGYRLPTSAEWEYACRSGTTTPWSFGQDGEYLEYFANCARSRTTGDFQAPGLLRPNAWGLFDMLGNIAEWTDTPCIQLPANVLAKDHPERVRSETGTVLDFDLRGGDCNSKAADARSARRLAINIGLPRAGFRMVRTLP